MNAKVIKLKNENFIELLSDVHIAVKSESKYMFSRKNGKSVMSMKYFVDHYCPEDLTESEKQMIYKRWLNG